MGIYLNPNYDSFVDDFNNDIYVDKSMIIEKLNNLMDKSESKYICVTRPRRFGKTMATNLISAFYSKGCDSRSLFSNLKIAQTPNWDKNLNKFNVIKIDVQPLLTGIAPEDLVHEINISVNEELMESFPNAKIQIDDYLNKSLLKVYTTTREQFILIMDEYDILVRNQVSDKALELYLDFLNGLFKNSTLKPAIHLAYLTGIFPIVRDKNQSKLNEVKEYSITMPRELSGFIGFTETEVKDLCKQYNIDFSECKKWYDGYKIGTEESIYNPCSVVEAITNKNFDYYWSYTGSYESIEDYITLNFEGIKDDIISMIAGKSVKVDVSLFLNTMTKFKSKDDVYTYLIHLGYLAYKKNEKGEGICWIPNKETRTEWIKAITTLPDYSEIIKIINE